MIVNTNSFLYANFAVKFREALIAPSWQEQLFEYIGGILRDETDYCLAVGGWKDHVHLFYEQKPSQCTSDISRAVKANSSRWIRPAIEQFILDSAASVNISLEDFGLPTDLKNLCKTAKKINSKFDPNFKSLFRAIHAKKAPQFQRLAGWIRHLKNAPYDVELNGFFEL